MIISLGQRMFAPGNFWASVTASLIILNGVVLVVLGIIGEYIGRIFDEVKDRPLYILRNPKGIKRRRALEVRRVV